MKAVTNENIAGALKEMQALDTARADLNARLYGWLETRYGAHPGYNSVISDLASLFGETPTRLDQIDARLVHYGLRPIEDAAQKRKPTKQTGIRPGA